MASHCDTNAATMHAAVAALHAPSATPTQRHEANAYLTAVQESSDSWPTVCEVLRDMDVPLPLRQVAAQILKEKLRRHAWQADEVRTGCLFQAPISCLVERAVP